MSDCEAAHETRIPLAAWIHPEHYNAANDSGKYVPTYYPNDQTGPFVKWVETVTYTEIDEGTGKEESRTRSVDHFWHLMFCRDPRDAPVKYVATWLFHQGQGDDVGQSPDPGGHPPGPNKHQMYKLDWENKLKRVIEGEKKRDLDEERNAIVDDRPTPDNPEIVMCMRSCTTHYNGKIINIVKVDVPETGC